MLEHLGINPAGKVDYVPGLDATLKDLKEKGAPLSADTSPKYLLLACSSDRGLCGSIHSSVSKTARRLAGQDRPNVNIVVLGDKAKPQISRDSRQNIVMHFNQVGKNIPSFLDALVIWEYVSALKKEQETPFTHCALLYNRFVSAINFETVISLLPEVETIKNSEKLGLYECESSVLENFAQYLNVSRLYWALVEGHAAEMSSKRTAMENATKNAEAIVIGLTMKYNRTRQAVITNELVDIITGASAL